MRTLIRGTNWIGDCVMSLAALREVRRLFPADHITLLARRWVAGIVEEQGLVDDVLHVENLGPGWRAVPASIGRLQGFDRAILFQNAFKAGLQAFLARIPERIGYDTDGRRLLLSKRATPRIKQLGRHQVFYYLDLLYQSGVSSVDYLHDPEFRADISLSPRPVWLDRARSLIESDGGPLSGPLVTLNPGAFFGPAKRWFPDRFANLAQRLIDGRGCEIALVGSSAEAPLAEEIRSSIRGRVRLLTGKTDLPTLMGALRLSDCFVTNDSGPMHLAAALDVPQVALFGSTDEIATGPFNRRAQVIHKHVECSPCLLRECPIDLRCFGRIAVEEVLQRVCRTLDEEARKTRSAPSD